MFVFVCLTFDSRILKYHARVIVKERTVQAKLHRSDQSWPPAVTPRKSASPPTPRMSNAKLPYSHAAAVLVGATHITKTRRPQQSTQLQPCTALTGKPSHTT